MKFRPVVLTLVVAAAMMVVAGCGSDKKSDSKDSKTTSSKSDKDGKDGKKKSITVIKKEQLDVAKKEFKKHSNDKNACSNLAQAYIVVGSPESNPDSKEPPKRPKDSEKNFKKAADTLDKCVKLDPQNVDLKSRLASTYMALNRYDDAAPILKTVAESRKTDANAYYAWGLAASNARNTKQAVQAWEKFLQYAPKKDPRIQQVQQSIKALK